MSILKKISNAFKRRLDPTTKLMVEVGYLSNDLERTHDGIHFLLNFLEEKFSKDFIAFLGERRKALEGEEEKGKTL